MKKTFFVVLALLVILAGWFYISHTPFPSKHAREAFGAKVIVPPLWEYDPSSAFHISGKGPKILLVASAGREVSDFNELVTLLNTTGYTTATKEHIGISNIRTSDYSDSEFLKNLKYFKSAANKADNYFGFLKTPHQSDTALLIGHAYGNRVVRMSAYHHPDNVKGVILLAAGGQVPPDPEADAALKRVFDPLKSYKSRMADVRMAFFAPGNEIPDHWTRGWHTKTAIAQGKAMGDGDDSWHCAGGVPMLIVQPMQDKIAPPANAYALRDKCPQQVEIVEVQNAGHALLPEQPEAVAKAVLDFLAKYHPVN